MTEQYIEELIRKYADGTASKEEVKILMDWYRFSDIGEVHWASPDQSEAQRVSSRMLARLQNEILPARSRVISFSWAKVAAVLLAFLGVTAVFIYFLTPVKEVYTTVVNPSGKIQLLNLPDSSKVWLNASTTLRYSQTFKTTRKVKLDGEAYFEVTHDQSHPFVVNAGSVQTTVLGTTFNVNAYGNSQAAKITVLSGKVRVRDSLKELAVLMPGRQLSYNKQTQIAITNSIDTTSILAWRSDRLQFQGETFAEIASAMENWYGIKILLSNSDLGNCRYYLNLDKRASIDKILSLVAETTEMEYAYDKTTAIITFSGKGCL
jgi:ferric-dicitrate binding protein FerR (iron transport regulator)